MPNKRNLIIISAAAFAVILLLSIINLSQLSNLRRIQMESTELILSESAANRKTNDYLNNISGMLAHDLNRTRASLGLEVSSYPFQSITDDGPEKPVADDDNEMIDAIAALMQAEADNNKSAMLGRFFRNSLIVDFLSSNGSNYEKLDNLTFDIKFDETTYITAYAVGENSVLLRSFTAEELNINSASKETVHFLKKNLEELKLQIANKKYLTSQLLRIKDDVEINNIIGDKIILREEDNSVTFYNNYNDNIIKTFVNQGINNPSLKISGNQINFSDYKSFKNALIKEIREFDLRTNEIVMLDKAKNDLETKLNDEEFKQYLLGLNLSVSSLPREDLDYYYYDINYLDGKRLGSFSILKKIGEIYLVDADEVPVSSLKTLSIKKTISSESKEKIIIPENIPQIDNLYSSQDTVTFLLVGNHEKNTDTMILAHANKITGKAYMIGIPRDLYWKGRKINSIYLNYGAEQFKKELSEITGLDITNYIIADMYAFIDIVNILGGIEVTLNEDLIDPTYKIRENGEWATLNYAKGTYNLNGVEALRVARSRHGSNDFDRSERQQQILEAFLNKILEIKISDVDKVYSMMQAIFEYVDTDFSLIEMMSLFNNYSNVTLAGKHVLSFDNILYDTYSNTYMLEDQDIKFDDDFNKGAWILFPRDNNWNNIRWYVRQIINGEI